MALASTLAVDRASDPLEGVVAHEDGLGRAHGEGGAQARRLAAGRHRDQGDLAPAGGFGELQAHLDAVGVGVVEDQLALPDQGVGLRVEGLGGGRIGDLLHTDDDVHGLDCSREQRGSTNPPGRRREPATGVGAGALSAAPGGRGCRRPNR